RGLARRRQHLQRAGRAMHLIADAADIEDDKILAIAVDQAFQLADHRCDPAAPGLPSPLRGGVGEGGPHGQSDSGPPPSPTLPRKGGGSVVCSRSIICLPPSAAAWRSDGDARV